jgi:hypothetical protein
MSNPTNNSHDNSNENRGFQLIPRSFWSSNPAYSPINRTDEDERGQNPSNNGQNNQQGSSQGHDYYGPYPDDDGDYEGGEEEDEYNSYYGSQRGSAGGAGGPAPPTIFPDFIQANNGSLTPASPSPTTPGTNATFEQARRQRMLRMLMIFCVLLFLMDSSSNGGAPSKKDNNSSNAPPSDEILLPSQEIGDLRSFFFPLRDVNFKRQNLTGFYRGEFELVSSSKINSSSSFAAVKEKEKKKKEKEGVSILQFRTVNIYNVPDLSFIYGVTRVYEKAQFQKELSYPFQGLFAFVLSFSSFSLTWFIGLVSFSSIGILITSLRKVILMPTIYKSQRLMMEITSSPSAASSFPSLISSHFPSFSPTFSSSLASFSRRLFSSASTAENKEKKDPFYYYTTSDYEDNKNSSIILRSSSSTSPVSQIRIFVNDFYDHPLNTSSSSSISSSNIKSFSASSFTPFSSPFSYLEEGNKRTFMLGESMLPSHFKLLQGNHPPKLVQKVIDAIKNSTEGNTGNGKGGSKTDGGSPFDAVNNLYANPTCSYFLEFSISDSSYHHSAAYGTEDIDKFYHSPGSSDNENENNNVVKEASPSSSSSAFASPFPSSFAASFLFSSSSASSSNQEITNEEEHKGRSPKNMLLKDESIPHSVSPAVLLDGKIRNCHEQYSVKAVSYEAEVNDTFLLVFLNFHRFS